MQILLKHELICQVELWYLGIESIIIILSLEVLIGHKKKRNRKSAEIIKKEIISTNAFILSLLHEGLKE